MIFEQENVVFQILDVIHINQENIDNYNTKRNFDALSFRYEADTVIRSGKKIKTLCDNSICFVPSNINYRRYSKKDNMIVVHFISFNYHSNEIETFMPNSPEKYSNLFTNIFECWSKKDISYKNECASLLNKIFSEMYKENTPVLKNNKISNSILYLEKNYLHKDFSLSEAAAKSYVTETYFRRLFKKEFGISPKRYVIEQRMEYAKALIISGYFSIRTIADMCGYNDEKHFSAEFKKITGIPPSKFKYNYME